MAPIRVPRLCANPAWRQLGPRNSGESADPSNRTNHRGTETQSQASSQPRRHKDTKKSQSPTVPDINAKAQRRRGAKGLVLPSSVRESPTGRTAGDPGSPSPGEQPDVVGSELPPPSAFSPAPRLWRVGSAWAFLMMWIRRVGFSPPSESFTEGVDSRDLQML